MEEAERVIDDIVSDILNTPTEMVGERPDSLLLWMQREYVKLMHREIAVATREKQMTRKTPYVRRGVSRSARTDDGLGQGILPECKK